MFVNVVHRDAQDDAYHTMEGYSFSQIKLLPLHPEEFAPLGSGDAVPDEEFGRLYRDTQSAEQIPALMRRGDDLFHSLGMPHSLS